MERDASYAIDDPPLARIELAALLSRTSDEGKQSVPFSQANDLDKAVDLLVFLE